MPAVKAALEAFGHLAAGFVLQGSQWMPYFLLATRLILDVSPALLVTRLTRAEFEVTGRIICEVIFN
jgi:hypothetical protein